MAPIAYLTRQICTEAEARRIVMDDLCVYASPSEFIRLAANALTAQYGPKQARAHLEAMLDYISEKETA